MNEVFQDDPIKQSVTLDQEEIEKLMSSWSDVVSLSVCCAIVSVLSIFPGIISLQKQVIDPSSSDYGWFYYLIYLGLYSGFTAYSVLSKTIWGRIIGIISCWMMLIIFPIGTMVGILGLRGLSGAKQLYGKNGLDYKEIKIAYEQQKPYTTIVENIKKNEDFTETAYMSVGSFICSIWVFASFLLLYILMILFPFPPIKIYLTNQLCQ